MKPGRCTLLLSIFILTFLRVSGKYMPIIRKTYCIYVTLVFCTLYAWLSGLFRATMCPSSGKHTVSMRHWYFALCMGGCLVCFGQLCAHYQEKILYLCDTDIFHSVWVAVWSADQTATHTEWKIPVSHRYSMFSWWWAHSCPKHVEKMK